MKKITAWVLGALVAFTLIGAPSAAMANEEPIRLPAPVQTGCGASGIDVPEVEGVTYGVYDYTGTDGSGWIAADGYDWQPGEDIIVIASYSNWTPFGDDPIAPEGDYALDASGNPGWWFTNTCTTVTAIAPTWDNPAGPGNLTAILPTVEGVSYKVTRYSTGKVKVVASALPGYVLVGTTQWSKLDTN